MTSLLKLRGSTAKVPLLNLNVNSEFLMELKSCLLLKTVKEESTETVRCIVEGLGYKDTEIRGISSKTFLAYFPMEDNIKNIDIDFLTIGFEEVREANWDDLIPTRTVMQGNSSGGMVRG